jgi:hypothetical protein
VANRQGMLELGYDLIASEMKGALPYGVSVKGDNYPVKRCALCGGRLGLIVARA